MEFSYNRTTRYITYTPFEIVYDFNSLTPLNLIYLPVDEKGSWDGKKDDELVRSIHEKVQLQIEKKNKHYAS